MSRRGKVYYKDFFAGIIEETEDGYNFQYDESYLKNNFSRKISLSFPLQSEPFHSNVLFPFFDGIIPEGWLLEIAQENWKINPRDRMALLLSFCEDTIGAVKIIAGQDNE